MLGTMWDLEIRIVIPFDEIVNYPDDFVDEYIEEPYFKKIRDLLEIKIDVRTIVEEIYNNKCRYNILYSEGNNEIVVKYGVDFSLFNKNSEEKYRRIMNGKRLEFYKAGELLKDFI